MKVRNLPYPFLRGQPLKSSSVVMPINYFPIDTCTIAFARIIALVVEAIKNVYSARKNIEYFSS